MPEDSSDRCGRPPFGNRGGRTSLQVTRLPGNDGRLAVHGFLVTHPGGAVLVDTGVCGPEQVLTDSRVVNRSVADALDEHDMTPSDIDLVISRRPFGSGSHAIGTALMSVFNQRASIMLRLRANVRGLPRCCGVAVSASLIGTGNRNGGL